MKNAKVMTIVGVALTSLIIRYALKQPTTEKYFKIFY